jgi:biofilm PGA synthesis N-glycosyltransferase PgaC
VACYNEENTIEGTIRTILNTYYPKHIELLVINDGSNDHTPLILAKLKEEFEDYPHTLRIYHHKTNQGKASALNTGLDYASYEYLVTIDADTLLHSKALTNIMSRFRKEEKDKKVGAVAGSIMVKNSKQSWITRLQTWDYFLGIAAVKRQQGTYESTLVAQGAFSAYRKEAIMKVGGWQSVVGEDIVLSWGMLRKRYCVFFESTALAFTHVPVTFNAFFRQRKRWARGMFEAFRAYPDIFSHCKDSTKLLIAMNLFFPIIDFSLMFFFIPGLILAFFGIYLIVGIMTLLVLPLAITMTLISFMYQRKVYRSLQEEHPRIRWSYVVYLLTYAVIQAPISLVGYLEEFLSLKKRW